MNCKADSHIKLVNNTKFVVYNIDKAYSTDLRMKSLSTLYSILSLVTIFTLLVVAIHLQLNCQSKDKLALQVIQL